MSSGPSVYLDDTGTWCYRLSAWGACIRDLVAARRGITPMPQAGEPDPWLREGHLHEADVVDQLTEQGWEVTDRQSRVELMVPPGKIIGHLDGKVSRTNPVEYKPHVLEVKALGKNTFAEADAMGVEEYFRHHATYAWQVSGAMWAEQQEAVVVVKSRDSGKVLVGELTTPPKSMEDFEKRMAEIEEWVDVDRFPPCEKTGFCWKGEYRHIHYKDGEPKAPIPIHETRNKAVEELSEKLHDVRKKKRVIEQQEEELKDELLGMAGDGKYIMDKVDVTIREVESKRMDQKAVRAEHGDKYDLEVRFRQIRIDPK